MYLKVKCSVCVEGEGGNQSHRGILQSGVVSGGVREISFSDGSRSWTSVAICFVSTLTCEAFRFCEVDMTKSTYGKRRIKSGKKKGGSKKDAIAIASSASGNNGGFREALRLKPLPPARQLKGGKGRSEILLPGAYVDSGKVLPGAYVDFRGMH